MCGRFDLGKVLHVSTVPGTRAKLTCRPCLVLPRREAYDPAREANALEKERKNCMCTDRGRARDALPAAVEDALAKRLQEMDHVTVPGQATGGGTDVLCTYLLVEWMHP